MGEMMVAALFVRRDSIYKSFDGIDAWDIDRDARNYKGVYPVICHPPCRAWGQLSHMAKPRPDEKALAIHAINVIRKVGGVLEHPRGSKLWREMGLPKPGQTDSFGGFSVVLDQFVFGHKAVKRSLLYINGCKPQQLPPVPMRFDAVEYTVASKIKKHTGRRIKKEITKKEREATPPAFARWLIEVAELCKR